MLRGEVTLSVTYYANGKKNSTNKYMKAMKACR